MVQTNEWLTVANAARLLSVSEQAIRQRIYRNTISHYTGEGGTVFVRITEHNSETNGKSHAENIGSYEDVNRDLVGELRNRVGFLERQLEAEREANRENRRIIAACLVQRVPELEASSDPRENPETTAPEIEGVETPLAEKQRSWWRRLFDLYNSARLVIATRR